MVHKETVAQRESARCFLFDLQNMARFRCFNAHFVSLLQNRKNMRSPVYACTYSANAPYLFTTNIETAFYECLLPAFLCSLRHMCEGHYNSNLKTFYSALLLLL